MQQKVQLVLYHYVGFKHRVKLANSRIRFDRLQFDKVDMDLFPTILDSTTTCPNAARYSRCRGYDHVNTKEYPF